MKKLIYRPILLGLLGLFFFTGQAQVNYSLNYDYDLFETIQSNSNHIYTYNMVSKTYDKNELKIYDLKGVFLNSFEFQARTRFALAGVSAMGDNTVFDMQNGDEHEILIVNKGGKEVARKLITPEDKLRDFKMLTSTNSITLVTEVKVKKVGIGMRVERLNANLESQWKYEKFGDGKYFFNMAASSQAGNVAVLIKNGNVYEYSLLTLDAKGTELAFVEVDEQNEGSFTPYLFNYLNDNELLMVSDFGSTDAEVFKGIPQGVNIQRINSATGVISVTNSLSFLEVQNLVGDKKEDGLPVYQVGPALRVLDLQTINGMQKLICESYFLKERKQSVPSSTAGAAPTVTYYNQLQLMDFYLLNLDKPAKEITRIWKQPRTVELETGSFTKANDMCEKLKYNNMFSYQGMYNNQLLIRGFGQLHNFYNLIPVDAKMEQMENRIYWGDPINCEANAVPQRQSYSKGMNYSLPKSMSDEGLLPSANTFMLFDYDGITNQLLLTELTF